VTRLEATFAALRAAGRKALVPFVTAGDPGLQATVPVMHALVAAGADVLELGVPFSDPMADGPVIQRSSERALARGAGLPYVFDCVRGFRIRDDATPVVLMGYLNPVEIRGAERFARDAAAAGVDGVLLVDLPPEEAGELRAAFASHGLALILLAATAGSAFAKCEGEDPPEFCKDVAVNLSIGGGEGTLQAGIRETVTIDVSLAEQPYEAKSVVLTFARVADGDALVVPATASVRPRSKARSSHTPRWPRRRWSAFRTTSRAAPSMPLSR